MRIAFGFYCFSEHTGIERRNGTQTESLGSESGSRVLSDLEHGVRTKCLVTCDRFPVGSHKIQKSACEADFLCLLILLSLAMWKDRNTCEMEPVVASTRASKYILG